MIGRERWHWLVPSIVSALVLFALHNFNAMLESGLSRVESEERQVFIRRRLRSMAAMSFAALCAAVWLSFGLNAVFGIVYGLSLALYAFYSSPLLGGNKLPPGGLRAIPGSRDILFALGWVVLLCLLPAAGDRIGGAPMCPPREWRSGRSTSSSSSWADP